MAVWALILVSAIVSMILIGWGYSSSNVTYAGFEHMSLYIGFILLAGTIFILHDAGVRRHEVVFAEDIRGGACLHQ
jgi:hypothetical protein